MQREKQRAKSEYEMEKWLNFGGEGFTLALNSTKMYKLLSRKLSESLYLLLISFLDLTGKCWSHRLVEHWGVHLRWGVSSWGTGWAPGRQTCTGRWSAPSASSDVSALTTWWELPLAKRKQRRWRLMLVIEKRYIKGPLGFLTPLIFLNVFLGDSYHRFISTTLKLVHRLQLSYSHHLHTSLCSRQLIISSARITTPVRPTPALQCTTTGGLRLFEVSSMVLVCLLTDWICSK